MEPVAVRARLIEDLPFLTADQNMLIDAVLMTGFARYDEINERSSDDCE